MWSWSWSWSLKAGQSLGDQFQEPAGRPIRQPTAERNGDDTWTVSRREGTCRFLQEVSSYSDSQTSRGVQGVSSYSDVADMHALGTCGAAVSEGVVQEVRGNSKGVDFARGGEQKKQMTRDMRLCPAIP